MQNEKQISLVILRLEIDDYLQSDDSTLHIRTLFNYNSDLHIKKNPNKTFNQEPTHLDLPESFTDKKVALKAFIGQRFFHSIEIETYYFQEKMSKNKTEPLASNTELVIKETKSSSISDTSTLTTIPYYSGNPTVDLVKGLLHIYKDSNLTSLDDSTLRSEMLCMIGIPSSITCNELLDFVLPFSEGMQYLRVVRDTCPNQYMVLLKFKSQKEADDYFQHNNNKAFNSIEDSACHLVFIESIEALGSDKGASLPIPGFTELPNCYICLEKMDESLNGVITILCNHSFHANCLSKWGDTSCPVCRFSQTPDYSVDSVCANCGSHENLWICLICGHIGCGRYVRGHAYNHFQLTQHTYSMQLGSNRVWDYAGDNYVHRLIQNKTDGKLVQLDEAGRIINQDEKVDSITLEYTYLLTMQLESQRKFFEERLFKQEEKSQLQILEQECKAQESQKENIILKETVDNLSKEKTNLDKKCSQLNTKLAKIQSELNEEKELNKCLTANQNIYLTKVNELEEKLKRFDLEKNKEIQDLQEQLRDVLFYLDAQKKMSENDSLSKEELQDSHIIIQGSNVAEASGGSGSSRRRKKK